MLATSTLQLAPEEMVQASIEAYLSGRPSESFLITGAPGMGKTSFLEACIRNVRRQDRILFVSGSVLASEGHFVNILHNSARQSTVELRDWRSGLNAFLTENRNGPLVLAIDDFDQLAYKRDELTRLLAATASAPARILLLLTGARSTVDRIVGTGRPFADLLKTISIEPLDEAAAEKLIQLRSPTLSEAARTFVLRQTGGHPGAIVFLCRITESLCENAEYFSETAVLASATEFAGAVYAEPWSALGPQQRAILWHLSNVMDEGSSITHIARALVLQPSHVSAQLARLVDEGLIRRDGRGSYAIAPLLARWIVARGARVVTAMDNGN